MPSHVHPKAIGQALIARRTSLDPTHHRKRDGWMATVTTETDLSKRVIIDIETGARTNYSPETLTTLEGLYRLKDGTLQSALAGGRLVSEDGTVLHPTPGPQPKSTDRFVVEERRNRLSGRLHKIVHDLEADTDGIPDEEAEEMLQRAMDTAETQARLYLDMERRRWKERHETPSESET